MKISLTYHRLLSKQHLSLGVIFAAYAAGILAIGYNFLPELLIATPFNLSLTFGLIFYNSRIKRSKLVLFMFSIYLIGFMVELIGVNTGAIFGAYSYGNVLGPKILHTPIIIGINWIIMVYGGLIMVHQILPRVHMVIKALLTASLMVLIDFLLEPVAMYYDFWSWDGGEAPFANYFAWFAISFIIAMISIRSKMLEENWVAIFSLICITIFFLVLNIRIDESDWISFSFVW